MGKHRSGAPRAGAEGRALTRRQQRQIAARAERVGQGSPRPKSMTKTSRLALPAELVEAPVAPTTTPDEPLTLAAPSARSTAEAGAAVERADGADAATGPHAAQPNADVAQAPESAERASERVRADAPEQATDSLSATGEEEPAPARRSGKFPTLARMATASNKLNAASRLDGRALAEFERLERADASNIAEMSEPRERTPEAAPAEPGRVFAPVTPMGAAPVVEPSAPVEPAPGAAAPETPATPRWERALRRRPWQAQAEPAVERSAAFARRSARLGGLRPLPRPDTTIIAACVHVGMAALAALVGAGLLVEGGAGALWAFAVTGILALGGWLAYALRQRESRLAGAFLLLSQASAIIWLLALVGPRAATLALAPAIALLALRVAGRFAAVAGAGVAFVAYVVCSALTTFGALRPALTLGAGAGSALDGALLLAGLGLTLWFALDLAARLERATTQANARLYEARSLRNRLATLRRQMEDEGEQIEVALEVALRGRQAGPVEGVGVLSPLAERVNETTDRLAHLYASREQHLRLESAIRTVTRAVERAWLGLPWSWPAPTDTSLDELVALLRAPRPQGTRIGWTDETPPMVPIPSQSDPRLSSSRWPGSGPLPRSARVSVLRANDPQAAPAAWSQYARPSDPDPYGEQREAAGLESLGAGWAITPRRATPPTTLPWREWDPWREWSNPMDE